MRHFILLFYLLTTICACTKQNTFKDNDLVKRNLIGDVKHIKTEFYEVAHGNDSLIVTDTISSQGSDQSNYIEFNKQGNITYLKEYNREVKCRYNEDKLLEHVVISDYYGKGSTETYDYFYNKSDSVVKVIIKNNRERSILNMQRDHIGRLVKRIELKGDSVYHTYERVYDNNGNLLNENTYYGTNIPYILISMKYDSQSKLKEERIKQFTSDSDLNYNCIRVFTKDQNNRALKIKESYGCDTVYAEIVKKYNENDILIEESRIPYGMRRIPVFLKKFDKYGNQIESSRLFQDGSSKKWTSTYTYDSTGNWTKRVNFTDGIPKTQFIRTIEYYK